MISNQFVTNEPGKRERFEFYLDDNKNLCLYAEENGEELVNVFVVLDKEDAAVLLNHLKALYKEM